MKRAKSSASLHIIQNSSHNDVHTTDEFMVHWQQFLCQLKTTHRLPQVIQGFLLFVFLY